MWKKRIETSLNVPWRYVEPVLDDIDEWIIDIKDMDRSIYKKYTGVDIQQLIENLFRIRKHIDKSKLRIRVPRIPGFNEEEDVEESIKWIKDVLEVEPEVFEYYVPTKVNENAWDDFDDEDEEDE